MKTRFVQACLAVTCCYCTAWAQPADWDERVDEELQHAQSYSGEDFDRLVALGPDVVEPLCARLDSYKFPAEILRVLAELGDQRATRHVIEFLEDREEDWATNDSPIVTAIRTLGEINDPAAEPILKEIASEPWVHFSVDFAAITALARVGRPKVKKWAWGEISAVYFNGQFSFTNGMRALGPGDVYPALCEIESPDVQAEVARVLTSGIQGYVKTPMLQKLGRRESTRSSPLLIQTLRDLAQSAMEGDVPDEVNRLYALEALCKLQADVPREELMARLEELKATSYYESKSFRRHFIVIERAIRQRQSEREVQS